MTNATLLHHKCKHHDGRVWCGYLLPVEILSLVALGVKPSPGNELMPAFAKLAVKEGKSNPRWFYFIPPKGLFPVDDDRKA